MYGNSSWISFLDNKRCDWFKTLKYENFEAWEIWQAYKHSSRPLIFGKVNIADVIFFCKENLYTIKWKIKNQKTIIYQTEFGMSGNEERKGKYVHK